MTQKTPLPIETELLVKLKRPMRESTNCVIGESESGYVFVVCPNSNLKDKKHLHCEQMQNLFEVIRQTWIPNNLFLTVSVAGLAKLKGVDMTCTALPFDRQPEKFRDQILNHINIGLANQALKPDAGSEKSPKEQEPITQPDPIQDWVDNNTEVYLAPTDARLRGKTDKPCATIVHILADRLGCAACDVINAVIWQAITDGSFWQVKVTSTKSNAKA